MKLGLAPAAFAVALAATTAASAEPAGGSRTLVRAPDYVEEYVDGAQVVAFPEDPLAGDPNSAYGFTVRRPPGVLRSGLLRPRMNFVSELLKSVENL